MPFMYCMNIVFYCQYVTVCFDHFNVFLLNKSKNFFQKTKIIV